MIYWIENEMLSKYAGFAEALHRAEYFSLITEFQSPLIFNNLRCLDAKVTI